MLRNVAIQRGLGAVLVIVVATPSSAGTDASWRFVTEAVAGPERYIVQVDTASLRKAKDVSRYWVQFVDVAAIEKTKTWSELHAAGTRAAQGPSLYESNCATGQSRILQGNIILGYDGPTRPLSRPANWEYVAPGSLMAVVHAFVCGDPHEAQN